MIDDYPARLLVEGAGEAVVLVPGMDGTGLLFYRQRPLLMRSRRVATYALRAASPDMPTLLSDLAAVIETVAPAERHAIVIGESFGGTLAMSLALERPERVAALVVVNSFAHFTPQVLLHMGRWGLRALPWGLMPLLRRAAATRLVSPQTGHDDMRQFVGVTGRITPEAYLNRLAILAEYDIRERLHELRMPTLFIAAQCDRLLPSVSNANFMASRVARATVRVLDGHGHACLIAHGVDLGQILDEWEGERREPEAQTREPRAQGL
jgi:pimeloyl-ACP methyl ester carboxylesterase